MIKHSTWTIPFLSALYWGSCQIKTDGFGGPLWAGDDTRAALCGFAAATILLLLGRQIFDWDNGGKR